MDGTEPGTHDYRWCASIVFGLRFILLLIAIFTMGSAYVPIATIVLVIVAILYIILHPFKAKKRKLTHLHVMFILLLATSYICGIGMPSEVPDGAYNAILGTASVLPLLYVSVII